MKLREETVVKHESTFVQFISLAPIILLFCMSFMLLWVFHKPWYWYVISIIIGGFIGITLWKFVSNVAEENIDKRYLKENGTKVQGSIVSTGKWHRYKYRHRGLIFFINDAINEKNFIDINCINVEYNDNIVQIDNIVDNLEYKILEELLNPKFKKNEVKIPVDVYVKNNKCYVDLDSVDLTKVDGYKSVRNILEHM